MGKTERVSGLLFGCEVLNACNGEASCVSSLVSRLKLEYCLQENEESLNKRAGGGKCPRLTSPIVEGIPPARDCRYILF
uniref:Uncharacterized protein n=1 Tax=Haemonchus contortus TaxID=6289 RepID=W6NVE6_HAECO